MEKIITYFGQKAKVACDQKCNKAFGINSRPRNLDENIDAEYLSDDELGEAPIDPGTYYGGDAKPVNKSQIPNKWCIRECERCAISEPGMIDSPLQLPDFRLPKKY